MTPVRPRPLPAFDTSSEGLTTAARDLGEVIALLAGGIRPDAETISRLGISLRVTQGFLLDEAREQAGREAIAREAALLSAVMPVVGVPV